MNFRIGGITVEQILAFTTKVDSSRIFFFISDDKNLIKVQHESLLYKTTLHSVFKIVLLVVEPCTEKILLIIKNMYRCGWDLPISP